MLGRFLLSTWSNGDPSCCTSHDMYIIDFDFRGVLAVVACSRSEVLCVVQVVPH